jgi:cytochrome c biogenesis protein CcdA
MTDFLADVRLPAVIITALVDSINPCAIGVLVLLISTLLGLMHDKKRLLWVGTLYIVVIYITYFLAGLGLLAVIQRLNIAEFIGILVGAIVILLGLVEIKDFFFYGKGFSLRIAPQHAEKIKVMVKKTSLWGTIVLGVFVAAVELPCTGGPYLAITAMLSKNFDLRAVYYLLIYNFIFVLPLIIILILAFVGTNIGSIDEWKTKNKKLMRLVTGIMMIALGVLLILFATNIISLT